ncbi:MAG TPA: NACHT domain-containing protein [Nitrospira sp.]|nr:NACHT domain-containing protein [Nitrospira sp.]
MSQSSPSLNPDGKDLLPSKAKQLIEVRLPGNVDEFSPEQQATFMQSLAALLKLGEVKVTRVVAGSIRLYLELDQEDADKLYSASKEGRLKELSLSEVRLYPAIAIPPYQEQRAQLEILRDRVQEYWIDGVLKQSLHREVLISLGEHAMDEVVEPPWKHILALPADRRHLLLQDRNITTIFDATGLLLILGEPGSGKTTTLLELACALIARAKTDHKERVPVVLNLSSWIKNQSIEEWIASEMLAKYRVPTSIAEAWLTNDYLAPLLDGLGEVQTASQPDCLAAINAFIENSKPSGMVVCCRLAEYQRLPERLKLNDAVRLEPLSPEDVSWSISLCRGNCSISIRSDLRTDHRTDLWIDLWAGYRAQSWRFCGGEALCASIDTLVDEIHTLPIHSVPRPLRKTDSPKEGRWRLHVHPPNPPRIFLSAPSIRSTDKEVLSARHFLSPNRS